MFPPETKITAQFGSFVVFSIVALLFSFVVNHFGVVLIEIFLGCPLPLETILQYMGLLDAVDGHCTFSKIKL